jgi:ribose transport system ATP-binding protein
MPENRDAQGLFMDFSVSHNITIKRLDKVYRGKWISLAKEDEKSQDVVGRLGIKTKDIHQHVRYLSGGNKQKTLVGRNVFSNCSIFVFDEPTKGVDIAGKVEIYNIINELIRKGAAIILVSSDFSELAGMCDRVLVIRKGSLVAELNQAELTHQKLFLLCKE